MTWQNYVVPVVGSFIISGFCYLLGHYHFSFGWILILVALHGLKSHMWRQREKRLLSLRQTALKEREVILAQLQDLPAWVQFPDTERVEWLNKVILQLWPYITEYSKRFMREYIEPQVKSQLPSIFRSFKFTKMDMGDIPCRVGGIKVYTHNVGRDRIIVDMDVAYAGDADFDVTVAGFTGGLNQLQFSGKLRAVLRPLLPYPPMVGGVSGFFLEKPKIDFNLTGMGEFVELPGLLNAIRAIIDSQVSALCVLPNEIVVPLAPNIDITRLHLPEPDGVVRLKIVEARNLENRDIKFTKSMASDPYCEIQIGSQFYRTKTIDNDLNPVWNEYFEFVVDQANGQKLRIELFDYDKTSNDEELGRLAIDLVNIKAKRNLDDWFPLDACKHGDIHIQAAWMNLSSSSQDFSYQEYGTSWFKTNKPVHSALLMIFIDSVSDLPYPKAKLEPSPYILVSLGKDFQQTPTKIRTVNPLFQSKILFFVRHPEGQEVKFEAIDHTTKRCIGELILPLKMILREPNLEFFEQTFPLTQGIHQSSMVITARIRALVTEKQKENSVLNDTKEAIYGNEVFIERAEKLITANDNSKRNRNSADHTMNLQKLNEAEVGGKALMLDSKLPIIEEMRTRRNSNESAISICRRRRTFGERLFSAKHTQSKEKPARQSGRLQFGLQHLKGLNKMIVRIIRLTELYPLDSQGSADPYITVRLTPIDNMHGGEKRKTSIIRNSLDPIFDNQFEFDLHFSDIKNHMLIFTVKDATNYGPFTKAPILGVVQVKLDSVEITEEFSSFWYDLKYN
ncbi:Extended synaptotagmin-2 [Dirofilaria immitis]